MTNFPRHTVSAIFLEDRQTPYGSTRNRRFEFHCRIELVKGDIVEVTVPDGSGDKVLARVVAFGKRNKDAKTWVLRKVKGANG